jgi:hypothetical protein
MTVAVVQAKTAIATSANPSLTFDSSLTAGNYVVVFHRHTNGLIESLPTGDYGVLFELYDSSAFGNGDLFSTSDYLGVYGAYVTTGMSSTFTLTQTQGQNTCMVAYELSGTWDDSLPVIETWEYNGAGDSGAETLALSGLEVTYEGGAVFAAFETRGNTTATLSHSMTNDRVDSINSSSNSTLTVAAALDADAGTYADTLTWTGAQRSLGVIVAIHDQGRGTVQTVDIADELTDMLATVSGAGLSTSSLLTAIETLPELLTTKQDRIDTHALAGQAVFLAPTDDDDALLPDVSQMWTSAIRNISGGTLIIPGTGSLRYHVEFPNAGRVSGVNGWTLRGSPRPDGLPAWELGDDPDDGIPTIYKTQHELHPNGLHFSVTTCNDITVSRLRMEGDDTVAEGGGVTAPILEAGRAEYDQEYEFQNAFEFQVVDTAALSDLYGYGIWGDGFYMNDVLDMTCTNFDIRWVGRQGFSIVSSAGGLSDGVTLDGFYIPNGRRTSFDPEPNFDNFNTRNTSNSYATVQNITVTNVISDANNSHVASGGRGRVLNVTVSNWDCVQPGAFAVATGTGGALPVGTVGRTGWLIENWTLRNSTNENERFSIGSLNQPPTSGTEFDWLAANPAYAYQANTDFTITNCDWEMGVAEPAIEFEFVDGEVEVSDFDGGSATEPDTSHPRCTATVVGTGNSWS